MIFLESRRIIHHYDGVNVNIFWMIALSLIVNKLSTYYDNIQYLLIKVQ